MGRKQTGEPEIPVTADPKSGDEAVIKSEGQTAKKRTRKMKIKYLTEQDSQNNREQRRKQERPIEEEYDEWRMMKDARGQ